jgi:flagellin
MSSVINTNITSLIAQKNLGMTQSTLQNTIQRLSSGLRVNSASDDASGYAIANRMDAQIRGMAVATRNANDAISFSQTSSGALSQISSNLQRMRELAVQAANGSNSSSDMALLNQEYNQLQTEIGRIQSNTNFNNVPVFQNKGVTFQVGANTTSGDRVNMLGTPLTSTLAIATSTIADKTTNSIATDLNNAIMNFVNNNPNSQFSDIQNVAVDAINSNQNLTFAQKTDLIKTIQLAVDSESFVLKAGGTQDTPYQFATKLNGIISGGAGSSLTPDSPQFLNGSGGGITTVSNLASLPTGSQSRTYSAWINPSTLADGRAIIGHGSINPSTFYHRSALDLYNGQLVFEFQVGDVRTNNLNLQPNTWSLVTATYSASSGVAFYVNGSQVTSVPGGNGFNPALVNTINLNNTATFGYEFSVTNGSTDTSTKDLYFNGSMANAAIWNTELTASQVSALYTNPNVLPPSGLVTVQYQSNIVGSGLGSGYAEMGNGITFGVSNVNVASNNDYIKLQLNAAAAYPNATVQSIAQGGIDAVNAKLSVGHISSADANNLIGSITSTTATNISGAYTLQQYGNDLHKLLTLGAPPLGFNGGSFTLPSVAAQTSISSTALPTNPFTVSQTASEGQKNASNAINKIDTALTEVNTASAVQGALQNRFTAVISNLTAFSQSQTAAKSRIIDADFASETAKLSKHQILQQAGTAMLAQANQLPSGILALLKNN